MENMSRGRELEELKRNVKLAKGKENDSEMQAYVEECLRLRGLLEQQCL